MIEEHTNTGRQEQRWSDRGQMSLNPAGTPLSRTVHGRSDVLLIHIAPELIREATEEICDRNSSDVFLVSRLAVPDETVFQIGNLLLKEAECGARGSGLVANSLARVLAVHLVREHSNVTLRLPETPATLAGVRLRRVMDHMRSHLDETQSLAHLAGLCGLSPSHFSRAFREATGLPPHRYLVQLRMDMARHLLETSNLPIIEIALRCGFERQTHFATMFRKLVGISPRDWRIARRS